MSAATDFLTRWIASARTHLPSVTLVTSQAPGDQRPGAPWAPGVACYAWAIRGRVKRNATQQDIGLTFSGLSPVYSDRVANRGASPPKFQRFDVKKADRMELDVEIEGDLVKATVVLSTWGVAFEARTTLTDTDGSQLLFLSVPPAGHIPTRAVMLLSFQPTGDIGFL